MQGNNTDKVHNTELTKFYANSDQFILKLLFGSWLLSFAYAFVYDTWIEALVIGLIFAECAIVPGR